VEAVVIIRVSVRYIAIKFGVGLTKGNSSVNPDLRFRLRVSVGVNLKIEK